MLCLFIMVILTAMACDGGNGGCGFYPTPTPEPTPGATPAPTPDPASTAVSRHGQLRVEGTQLVDQYGNPVQLKGMSSHWVAWFPQFINEDAIGWLVKNKKMTLFRVAMGIEPEGHYLDDPEFNKGKVIEAVEACIKLGIYVIIDWHDHNAHFHSDQAQEFFQEMVSMYGDTPNVLYEVFNEPEQISWKYTVKPYAQKMIDTIRAIDPDNIILVSTPQWCQRPQDAAADPVQGENIMYTLHFYAGTHTQLLRDTADGAMAQGLPIFVSEWGASAADGGANGKIYLVEAQDWITWMNKRKLSWAAWNLADKDESTAILREGADERGNWTDADFKGHGPFVLEKMAETNPYIDNN